MIKIGLLGEDPYDTSSIKHLLEKRYKNKVHFYPLAKGVTGDQLDTLKVQNVLRVEFAERNYKFVIYIRDLDAFQSEEKKIQARVNWFRKLDKVANGRGILLLNIWEIEALILSDIQTLNSFFNINYKLKNSPTFIKEPKEELKKITFHSKNKYQESVCPAVFKKLNIEAISKSCGYFNKFINDFDKML